MKPPLEISKLHTVKHHTQFVNDLPRALIAVGGYEQAKVAAKLNMSAEKLSRVLSHVQGISDAELGILARQLNCSIKMMVDPKFTTGYIYKSLIKRLKCDEPNLAETDEEISPLASGLIDSEVITPKPPL